MLELYLRQFPNAQVLALKQLLDADYNIIQATQSMQSLYKEFVTDPTVSSSTSSSNNQAESFEASGIAPVKEEEAAERSVSAVLTDAVAAANRKRAYFDYILPVLTEKQRSQFSASLARNWDDWRKIKVQLTVYHLCIVFAFSAQLTTLTFYQSSFYLYIE